MLHKTVNLAALEEACAINWSAIARRNGVHPSLLSHTKAGRSKSRLARSIIAAAFGLQPHQIWPDAKPHTTRAA